MLQTVDRPAEQNLETKRHPTWVRVIWVIGIAYVVGVLALTMWPNLGHTEVPRWAHLTLNWLNGHGIEMTFNQLERLANFLMFFPFGVLSGILLTHHRFHWHVAHRALVGAIAGIAFSGFIEIAQRMIPGRVSDPGDILMNGSGALVGAALVAIIMHLITSRKTVPAY